jgi:glycosyltransferase involved in cell wall biosynthesis
MPSDVKLLNPIERSKVSVISPSRNHGKFLRETIDSVLNQSYKNIEHVIVDGASTDNTVDILKEYPHLKWISEEEEGDNRVLDAIWKAFYMSNGEYIVFLCVSDGFVDTNWLKKATEILDKDNQVSHVWGLSQYMSEDGHLGKVGYAEFLEYPPPQKMEFLPLWLTTGHGVECNAIFRRHLFEAYHPRNTIDEAYRFAPIFGLNYHLNTQGYLPYFLPMIANYGRAHENQLGQKLIDRLGLAAEIYFREVVLYKQKLLSGAVKHFFRDSNAQIIGEVKPGDLAAYKKIIWRYRMKNSLQRKFQRILNKLR